MKHNYRKPELRGALEALDKANNRNHRREIGGVISRGRKADLDQSQLVIDDARQLRDPEDNRFWFVVGYSKVGGPDKIPPT